MQDVSVFRENNLASMFKSSSATRIRVFRFRLVSRVLTTNVFLQKIGVKDCNLCTFCGSEAETLTHLFWRCGKTQVFIREVELFLSREGHINLELDIEQMFFPDRVTDLEFLLITFIKLVIYRSRYQNTFPVLNHYRRCISNEAEKERLIAIKSGDTLSYESKWECWEK